MSLARWLPFWLRHLLPLTRQHGELRAQQQRCREALAALFGKLPPDVIDELALPSYTHRNCFMRYTFWERLAVALEWVDGLTPAPAVLMDFGSGVGLLLPPLARRGLRVLACDIYPEVTAAAVRHFGIHSVEVLDAREGLDTVPPRSVDAILALDVLEHVENLDALAAEFARVLRPPGRLLCSLPTENVFYRLGRRLAGFSGAYHLRKPQDVLHSLTTCFTARRIARLYPMLPLFDFFEARLRATDDDT